MSPLINISGRISKRPSVVGLTGYFVQQVVEVVRDNCDSRVDGRVGGGFEGGPRQGGGPGSGP